MIKKLSLIALAVLCVFASSCSKANDFGLKLIADGKDSKDYIYFDEERTVFVVGGIMMIEDENGESVMLDTALHDGIVSLDEIITSAQDDATDGDVKSNQYPDGSMEYYYDTFNLIVLNIPGQRDIYFVPTGVNYYSVTN